MSRCSFKKKISLHFLLVAPYEEAGSVCLLHASSFLRNDCMTTSQQNTYEGERRSRNEERNTSPGNLVRFVESLFSCLRAWTTNKIRQCGRQLQLNQVDNYYYFVMPASIHCISSRFSAKILFIQASFIYRETVAKEDDRDMPISVTVSLTVTTVRNILQVCRR